MAIREECGVIGVPDSGPDAAMGCAEESGIPYGAGLVTT